MSWIRRIWHNLFYVHHTLDKDGLPLIHTCMRRRGYVTTIDCAIVFPDPASIPIRSRLDVAGFRKLLESQDTFALLDVVMAHGEPIATT